MAFMGFSGMLTGEYQEKPTNSGGWIIPWG
jgi:hypothetical protein